MTNIFYVWSTLLILIISGCSATSDLSDGTFGTLTCIGGSKIKKKAESKRENLVKKQVELFELNSLQSDLSRGVNCHCSTIECTFRATLLTPSIYLANDQDYLKYLEITSNGYETNQKILASIQEEMKTIERKKEDLAAQSTCFNITIYSESEEAQKRKNWKMVLVGHDGTKETLELAVIESAGGKHVGKHTFSSFFWAIKTGGAGGLEDKSVVNTYVTTACSQKPIDVTKPFSLQVHTSIKDVPQEFTLDWAQKPIEQ